MAAWLTGAAVAVVLAAAGLAAWWQSRPVTRAYYTDGAQTRVPAQTASTRDVLWQPPAKLSAVLNAPGENYEPRLGWDESTLFLVRGRPGANADIYVALRTPTGFSEPQRLDTVCSEYDELGPEPSRDGQALYFYSDRPGGCGGYDIWVARCVDGEWQTPTNLGPNVNSAYNEYGPALSPDGRTLYFASNRPRPQDARQPDPDAWPATVREDPYHRTYDLYQVALGERGPELATALDGFNTEYNEGSPCVAPGGDFLYFASDRPGGFGGFDLYRARIVNGAVRQPENLGAAINTAANELDPGLMALGFGLYFSSDRPIVRVDPNRPNEYCLYYSASRDVFLETEVAARPGPDWAALARTLLPNLLWALLALLLLVLFITLLRDARRRRLSLMTRCLLGSLAVHALLMFALSSWRVTAAVAQVVRDRPAIQVALGASGGDALAQQIFGAITDPTAPAAAAAADLRPPTNVDIEPRFVPAQMEIGHSANTIDPVSWPANLRDAAPAAADVAAPPPAADLSAASPNGVVRLPADEPAPTPAAAEQEVRVLAAAPATAQRAAAPISAALVVLPGAGSLVLPQMQVATNVTDFASASPIADAPTPGTANASLPLPDVLAGAAPASTALTLPSDGPHPGQVAPEQDAQMAVVAADASGPHSLGPLPAPGGSPGYATVTLQVTGSRPDSAPMGSPGADLVRDATVGAPPPQQFALAADELVMPAVIGPRIPMTEGVPTTTPSSGNEEAPRQLGAVSPSMASRPPVPTSLPTGVSTQPALVGVPSRHGAASGSASVVPTSMPLRDAAVIGVPGIATLDPTRGPPTELTPTAVRLPTETAVGAPAAGGQAASQPVVALGSAAGDPNATPAVERALAWLVAHQSADGHWDGATFDAQCGGCGGTTAHPMNVTLTGLSTLALLGAGHTPARDGPYQDHVRRALAWLRQEQRPDGDLRGSETMYSHAIATAALAEALALTRDPGLEDSVRRAVDALLRAPNLRAEPPADDTAGDTAVLGWQVLALHSARLAGIAVPPETLAVARRWLARVEGHDRPGAYAYQPGQAPSEAMTAEGLFVELALGAPRDDPRTLGSVVFMQGYPPQWTAEPNPYYWYFGTLALFHVSGAPWQKWNSALTAALLPHQEGGGKAAGSWPPDGPYAAIGGRVYQTALCTLVLETSRKLLPLLAAVRENNSSSALRGRVTDAASDEPLVGALVRVDVAEGAPVAAYADAAGHYELFIPQMPENFAVTASHPDALPHSENASSAALRSGGMTLDFRLEPRNRNRVVLEREPEVHHLGNDRYEGAINSQFQKASEGLRWRMSFNVPDSAGARQARLTMLTRGVQCHHPIHINGVEVARFRMSPEDGSFGRFTAVFDPTILRGADNVLEIQTSDCSGDIDDFEFVNVQIELER